MLGLRVARPRLLLTVLALLAPAGLATVPSLAGAAPPVAPPGRLSIDRQLGQLIVGRFAGVRPSPAFLRRVRLGRLGGVILFSDNVAAGLAATRSLTRRLQAAAAQGGNPPLLIMTDQEGGTVRRLPGPPVPSARAMDSVADALRQGQAAGSLLRSVGVNLDLAPVADVERNPDSFLGTRAFGSTPGVVADRACAFARGLASRGVGYALKHFPGLGRATASTDDRPVSIGAAAAALRSDYLAYRRCAVDRRALVMVSSASYPRLTGPLPAVLSPATYRHELVLAAGAAVPTISDDLQAGALARLRGVAPAAIAAGLDLALYAGTESGSAQAYASLRAGVANGRLARTRVAAAASAVLALKRALAG